MPLEKRLFRQITRYLTPTLRTHDKQDEYINAIFGGEIPSELAEVRHSPRDFALRLISMCTDMSDFVAMEKPLDIMVGYIDEKRLHDAQMLRVTVMHTLGDPNAGYKEAYKRIQAAIPSQPQVLNLRNLMLNALPPEIRQLTQMETLLLGFNQIEELPPEIGQCRNLKRIFAVSEKNPPFGGNLLKTLPPEISQLESLEELHLDGNLIEYLPPEIGQLTGLSVLNLGGNNLTSLPIEIANLTHLKQFDLSGNQIEQFPDEITALTQLESLSLRGNQLQAIPAQIQELTNLKFLFLDDNHLTDLPPEIGKLSQIVSLSLDRNKLTSLPHELGQLTNLRWLTVYMNQLTDIPVELGQLDLEYVSANHNPFTALPSEVAIDSNNSILAWLKEQASKSPE